MKKIYVLSSLLLIMIFVSSCKENEKKEVTPIVKTYAVMADSTTINWTAYKTTAKVPVKGQFSEVTIENAKKDTTAIGALNGLKFKIPISSLITKDTIRDAKVKKYFFGTMENSSTITGTVHINKENSSTVDISLNGITRELPIAYIVTDNKVTIVGNMELDNWQAKAALEALNVVCKDLHTGDDGISKTWSDVKIEVIAVLKYE
ncbi:MAG: YceI family protein [Flavobacteriaceae bacterium]|nr:YceI family protein [Flavobacteriaceae bacterium]